MVINFILIDLKYQQLTTCSYRRRRAYSRMPCCQLSQLTLLFLNFSLVHTIYITLSGEP